MYAVWMIESLDKCSIIHQNSSKFWEVLGKKKDKFLLRGSTHITKNWYDIKSKALFCIKFYSKKIEFLRKKIKKSNTSSIICRIRQGNINKLKKTRTLLSM